MNLIKVWKYFVKKDIRNFINDECYECYRVLDDFCNSLKEIKECLKEKINDILIDELKVVV